MSISVHMFTLYIYIYIKKYNIYIYKVGLMLIHQLYPKLHVFSIVHNEQHEILHLDTWGQPNQASLEQEPTLVF